MFVSKDHVGKRFRRANGQNCSVNPTVNPLSRTFLKNWNESCLEKSKRHRLRFWTLELRCGAPARWTTMLFNDFNEQMDEIVLICIVNAHVNPLSRTFLKNWNI